MARRFPGLLIAAFVVIAVIAPVFAYRSLASSAPGAADGVVPDGTTVLNVEDPGVANLDPDLLRALRRAASAAADDGMGSPSEAATAAKTTSRPATRVAGIGRIVLRVGSR